MVASIAILSIRPVVTGSATTFHKLVFNPDLTALPDLPDDRLEGPDWFMGGDEPCRPDSILYHFIDLDRQPKFFGLGPYSRLAQWMAICDAREAWRRSL